MTLPTSSERDCEQAKLLLQEYSFDLQGFKAGELVAIWQERLEAEPTWIRAAVIEALYQGRYKAFSVEQILQGWKRRGHPVRHFNSEFERVVFGPIDPTVSKYALMTAQSPSALMLPQSESRLADSATAAIADPPPAPMTAARADLAADSLEENTDSTPEPPRLELPLPAIADSPPEPTAAASAPPPDDGDAESAATTFNQPAPIQKFQPQPEPSEFYQRLQAVARQEE